VKPWSHTRICWPVVASHTWTVRSALPNTSR